MTASATLRSLVPQPVPSFTEEAARLRVVESFGVRDLVDDPELEHIVRFAAALCGTGGAALTLVEADHEFLLARVGSSEREVPREISFCPFAMAQGGLMEVPDSRADPRFAENPFALAEPGVRFYAGEPLVSEEGAPLGALCVVDARPRPEGLTEVQRQGLQVLACAAMRRLNGWREALKAKVELAESEERFRALTQSIPDIAFTATAEGRFEYFNKRWEEFTGVTGWTGGPRPELIHPDDREAVTEKWNHACATGTLYESVNRLRKADGEWCWMLVRAVPAKDREGRTLRWYGTMTDVDASYRLSENRELLAQELSHRIKNIFAVVSGLVSLAVRSHPESKELGAELVATIQALGRAHDYVRPSGGQRRNSLLGMLGDLFAPYGEGRIHVNGAELPVGARAATPIALVFHELATNAVKYGALSVPEGRVEVTIEDHGDNLRVVWHEIDGPVPDEARIAGFGSRLVEMSITGQLRGTWERCFGEDGLVCRIDLPRRSLAAGED